ncbi:MAG: hypothetical protein AB1711_11880 [Thermodesulfobacteriota bacterium]
MRKHQNQMKLETKIKKLIKDLEKISPSPKNIKEAEEFNRKISSFSPEDLLRPFTI